MAHRGWVSAEVEPDVWKRLVVYDDGWIELSGFARGLSDARRSLKQVGAALLGFVGLFLLGRGLDLVGVPEAVSGPLVGVLAAVLFVVTFVLLWRLRSRDYRQASGDHAQARREKEAGQQLRMVPGAPRWRRADSAAQFASWVEGETHVDGADVLTVDVSRGGPGGRDRVVAVRLSSGELRTYRSPDDKLPELMLRFVR